MPPRVNGKPSCFEGLARASGRQQLKGGGHFSHNWIITAAMKLSLNKRLEGMNSEAFGTA
jgi:hypothetical protein